MMLLAKYCLTFQNPCIPSFSHLCKTFLTVCAGKKKNRRTNSLVAEVINVLIATVLSGYQFRFMTLNRLEH